MERVSLPTALKPVSYAIRLEPNFDEKSFLGHVDIICTVSDVSHVVKLHSKLISITGAHVEFQKDRWDLGEAVSYDDAQETLEVQLPEQIKPEGEAEFKISLDYTGQFKEDLTGFYQSSYETDDGAEHRLAATAMEPTYARKVFPCFDEPSLKAEFIVSVAVDQSFVAVSNMPVERSENISPSKKLVVFQRSLPMSTYHLGIVAGRLAEVRSTTSRVPMSIFCPIGSESQSRFSLELAEKGLKLFEDCFDSPYPLPKLDLIGVPDFSAGAMENWGIIMFRTGSLLLDPEDSALDTKQSVADTVLHEISHMWFGNLVTMRYWDGLWLKEGFAMLMAWYAADKIFPKWNVWDTFVTDNLQKALRLDSLHSSHAVELLVRDATNAKQMYDEISYEKGSCVLKMILDDLGEVAFFNGLKLYLRRHQFQSTESEDLWRAWEEVSGQPIADKMQIWTKQTGYPVVKVTEQLDESGQVQSYHLRQDRFLASGLNGSSNPEDIVYPLRIAIRSELGVETVDMNCREMDVPAPGKAFFKVNVNHGSFFRTSYSPQGLKTLLKAASDGQLSLRDCIGLSCDLRALTAAGLNRTSELLDLNLEFQKMGSFRVWKMIERNLQSIRSVWKFYDFELTEALRKVTLDILGPKAHELGWTISEDDDDQLVSFKSSMFNSAGLANDEEIIAEARALFAKRMAGEEGAIPGSLRWEVFGIVAAHGGLAELEGLVQLWQTSSNEDEQYLALECLGRAPNAQLVRWVLGHIFTKTIKDQDIYYLTWIMGSTSHGATELWRWTKENWDKVEKALPVHALSFFLGTALDGLQTEDQIKEVKEFFAARDTESYQMVLDQKLESMENRMRWAQRDIADVQSWLKSYKYL